MTQTKTILIAVFLVASLLLGACNSGETGKTWTTFESDDLGLSLDHPDSWFSQEDPDVLTLTDSEDTFSAEKIGTNAGMSFTPATSEDFMGANDPIEVLQVFLGFFDTGSEEVNLLEEPASLTINDQQAASVAFEGNIRGQEGTFKMTVITKGENLVIILSVDGSPEGLHMDTMDRIIESVLITKAAE
jgi:hypothetical protein